ncbi:MAG: aminotransferase class I/II-fold pyridoxal phosphate-dependent enzyme [Actinobacteria bacterium]|nr:aminotransferase class I/II-fold pyridoxal phosphate-dependent enzyme [Actinomycetota bacterium]
MPQPDRAAGRQRPWPSIRRVDSLLGNCSLPELRRRTGVKWRTYPADVLPAFVAEMDFGLAEPVIRAVTGALAIGDCGYAHKGRLGEAFADFAAARLGWAPDPARVYPIPDVMTGLAEVVMAVTPPGSGIVINPPVYPPFWFRFGFSGRRIIEAPLARDETGSYDLDPAAVDAALSEPGAAAYLLCSPHNPTGNVWSRAQLETVADICQRRGAVLLVDEIHAPLALPGARQVPFLSLDHEVTQRAFVFTSASKGWNIPGLKCGLAIAGSDEGVALLTERWEALLAAHLGVLASQAAFTEGLPWLDAAVAQLAENRALLSRLLAEQLPQAGYAPPQASFLAWLDCRQLGLGPDPAAAFLAKGRVAVSPGTDFGGQGEGFVRLNIGTSPALIEEAVGRMAAAVSAGAAASR